MVNSTREEAAVYAADGYARERGLGAAAVTFGVGALAGAAAMGGANAERVPVVMIAGAPGLGERDGRRLHHTPGDDIDAPRRALAQVVGETLVLDDLGTALERLDAALDRCVHDHRPLYVELPRDLVDERPAARPRRRARPPRAGRPGADRRRRCRRARAPGGRPPPGGLDGRGNPAARPRRRGDRAGRAARGAGRRVGDGQGRGRRDPPAGGGRLLRRVLGRGGAADGRAGRPGAGAGRRHQRHQHRRLHPRGEGGAAGAGRPHRACASATATTPASRSTTCSTGCAGARPGAGRRPRPCRARSCPGARAGAGA